MGYGLVGDGDLELWAELDDEDVDEESEDGDDGDAGE